MDQTPSTPVADENAGDTGDAIRATLDALLAERTQQIRQETFRDIQRATDKRFASFEQIPAALQSISERLSRYENQTQLAEEAQLEPEERQARQSNRQTQQLFQQKQAAEFANLQNYVYGLIVGECAEAGIRPSDPRLTPDAELPAISANPWAWHAAKIKDIARVQVLDARSTSTAQIQAAVEQERRKILTEREKTRVADANGRRDAASGQIERAVPSGNAIAGMAKYHELKAQGRHKEAREYMETLGKMAKAGTLHTVETG